MSISVGVLDILQNAPQPGDSKEVWNEKAWPFAAILYQLGLEINSTVANLNLEATNSVSTTSFAIGSAGTDRTFVVEANKSYAIGMTIRAAVTADGSKFVQGEVKAYNPTTGLITIAVNQTSGSGTFASWTVSQSISLEPIGLGQPVASASTPNIWLNDGRSRNYTGSIDTTGFANAPYAGAIQYLNIVDGVKFTGTANLKVPNGEHTCVPDDLVMVFATATNKFKLYIFKANGQAVTETPITSDSLPDDAILLRHLSPQVHQKVKALGTKCRGDKPYFQMMVQMEDTSLIGWGRAENSALSTGNSSGEAWTPVKPAFNPPIPSGQTIVKHVTTGYNTYVVLSNGWVYSCGFNTFGQCGHGDTSERDTLTRIEYFVTNDIPIVDVVADSTRSGNAGSVFFMNSTGELWACGYNTVGQLGLGDESNRTTPSKVASLIGITKVTISSHSGNAFAFALKDDGTVYATGYNLNGQLGTGDNLNKSSFSVCTGLSGETVTDISCSGGANASSSPTGFGGFALALSSIGEVYSTGFNGYGQLGQGNTASLNAFTKIVGLSDVKEVRANGGHYGYGVAVTNAGRLYVWGYNAGGVVGNGTTTNQTTPYNVSIYNTVSKNAVTLVSSDPPFTGKILKVMGGSPGYGHATLIVLDTDGNMWLSGWDSYYICGAGNANKTRFTPLMSTQLTAPGEKIVDFTIIKYDSVHVVFALSDLGYLYACGSNIYGVCTPLKGGIPTYQPSLQKVVLS